MNYKNIQKLPRMMASTVHSLNDCYYPIGYRVKLSTRHGFYHHWAISVGIYNGVEWFAENQKGHGVRYVTKSMLLQNSNILDYIPFSENVSMQQQILDKVESQIGKPYHLLFDNCEIFVNWVAEGKRVSPQVAQVALGTVVLGLIAHAITRK
jgi:hypothetical protein